MRIVSLLPSATEIVYALGRDADLVGVTFECDEPPEARRDKQVIVGGRDTSGMTPREIDDYVRTAQRDLYTLDADALAGLAPDVILTQDLCRVCAVPSGRVADALDHLGCTGDVVSLDPHTLDEVFASIRRVGERLGAGATAVALVSSLERRRAAVAVAVAGRPRVAVVEWVDPPFTAGHWVPDLVVAAGGEPVGAVAGGRSVATTWDALAALDPEVVLIAPCGFGLGDAVAQAGTVPFDAPVWAIDANALVVRPGPRLVDGIEAIAWALHPDAVPAPPPGRIAPR